MIVLDQKALTMYFLRRAHELYLLAPEKVLSPSFDDIEGKDHSFNAFDAILPSIEHSLGEPKSCSSSHFSQLTQLSKADFNIQLATSRALYLSS